MAQPSAFKKQLYFNAIIFCKTVCDLGTCRLRALEILCVSGIRSSADNDGLECMNAAGRTPDHSDCIFTVHVLQ